MNNNQTYDVAIIGGGLAGLCLSIQMVQQNYSVVLFEKEEYPFSKVCGEYISLESWPFLKKLGLNLPDLNLPIIKKLLLSDVKGRAYPFDLPMGGFGISRYTLDNALYYLALKEGVVVYTNSRVDNVEFSHDRFTISAKNQVFQSTIAAGCFGKRSNLDIKWKRSFIQEKPNALNNFIGIKYHIRYNNPSEEIQLHNFSNGYCGMSKIEEDKSCLCYLTTAANLKKAGNSISLMEQQFLFSNPLLKRIFTEAQFVDTNPLTISQVSFNSKQQIENHVFMIGDAAGMISPLCGNGMSMAMHASKLAAEAMIIYLSAKGTRTEAEQQYEKSWKAHFARRLTIGRMVQKAFGGNHLTTVFLSLMKAFPNIASNLIKRTHGSPF